jgi:hypothetical protein
MGMPISIHVRGADVDSLLVVGGVEAAFDLMRQADRLFSTYQHDTEVSRIRRGELDPHQGDPLVREVIRLCHEGASSPAVPSPTSCRTRCRPARGQCRRPRRRRLR